MPFRRASSTCAISLLACSVLLAGCGSSGGSGNSNPSPTFGAPVISSLSPSSATTGSAGFTLTAAGSNFVQGSEVAWNGSPLPTLYVSASSLQAPLSIAQLATSGTAQVTVVNPPSAGGATSNSMPLVISASATPNPSPTIQSLNPDSATVGSAAISITATGTNFVASSTVNWNGAPLSTTYVSSTSLMAQVPASDLSTAGTAAVTVVNPAPGGGTSGTINFTVNVAGTGGQMSVSALANSLAWDPVNQVIYLSVPSVAGSNGNSIQTLNPVTGQLGNSAFVGSEPNLMAVSSSSQYLYVGLDGASSVQRMKLPGLTLDTLIDLGADSFLGPYYAMDVQASPVADGTVAVVRGTPQVTPEEEGGVQIYDDSTARSGALCGFIESGCIGSGGNLFDSIQWNSTATEMYAANYEDTGFDFYTIPVTSSGFGAVTDYGGVFQDFYDDIHYDKTTGYVYDDNGEVVDPASGAVVGTFPASGLALPDGANGKIYFLGQFSDNTGSSTYAIESFDINRFVALSTVTLSNVVGYPTHLIRWGTNGLAFSAISELEGPETGEVYLISGSIVSQAAGEAGALSVPPTRNVQRTWPARRGVARTANPADEVHRLASPHV